MCRRCGCTCRRSRTKRVSTCKPPFGMTVARVAMTPTRATRSSTTSCASSTTRATWNRRLQPRHPAVHDRRRRGVRRIHQVCCRLDDIAAVEPPVLPGRSQPLPGSRFGCSGQLPVRRRRTATRRGSNGGEARWNTLVALPDFGSRVLSVSAVVAYVAVGAAVILSKSVTEAARDALAWVLPRDGRARRSKE